MAEIVLSHRAALAGVATGRFGAAFDSSRSLTLTALPEGHVLHLLAAPGAVPHAGAITAAGGGTLRAYAPGQWFVVGDERLTASQKAEIAGRLAGVADVVDTSHGRVRMALSGAAVERVLAKGTAVDLAPSAFPVGRSATTLVGHISVQITRTGEQSFELMVLRGFAESLWDELIGMAREFGVEAVGPA
ncbi:N-methylglutamate dehydrogenase subunit D [Rhizobium sp. RU20A]|uniref:sarcosine oxidase subunit gamma family protein n=1 Tax=Rhizobium sp. RU20A TaxID=1907412 RepID=UPI0009550211|nr:sarcosine oxidase subunit gamma family protein [Rhizobium sp. RU20A]SIQ98517.1 N-methylglutamate dehydrogenase subunit D [Rhizobium sp. RU20A]